MGVSPASAKSSMSFSGLKLVSDVSLQLAPLLAVSTVEVSSTSRSTVVLMRIVQPEGPMRMLLSQLRQGFHPTK